MTAKPWSFCWASRSPCQLDVSSSISWGSWALPFLLLWSFPHFGSKSNASPALLSVATSLYATALPLFFATLTLVSTIYSEVRESRCRLNSTEKWLHPLDRMPLPGADNLTVTSSRRSPQDREALDISSHILLVGCYVFSPVFAWLLNRPLLSRRFIDYFIEKSVTSSKQLVS